MPKALPEEAVDGVVEAIEPMKEEAPGSVEADRGGDREKLVAALRPCMEISVPENP